MACSAHGLRAVSFRRTEGYAPATIKQQLASNSQIADGEVIYLACALDARLTLTLFFCVANTHPLVDG